MALPGQLNPSPRVLLGPGPSDVHPRVLTAMATPLLGHLDPEFLVLMNETQERLRQVFRTQKRLSCPPGLAPVSFSPRAVEAINRRKTKVQSWYLDMTMVQRYWGEERFYHHTAPITMIYALREALRLVLEEGLEARFARHLRNHRALKAGLAALGIGLATAEGRQLPQLNALRIPAGADDVKTRKYLLDEFGIEIGGALGEWKGKVWRVGLMGHNSRPNVVLLFLGALEQCLTAQGVKLTPGAGVGAANEAYAQGR